MSTTTLRLNDDLKRRVTELAQRSGKSPHTFILEAIADKADSEEAKQDFHFQVDERLNRLVATGETVSWSEMREYLRKRAHGERTDMPQAQKNARLMALIELVPELQVHAAFGPNVFITNS